MTTHRGRGIARNAEVVLLDAESMWLGYLEYGGQRNWASLRRFLLDQEAWPASEYDVMAVVVNERANDLGLDDVVAYSPSLS